MLEARVEDQQILTTRPHTDSLNTGDMPGLIKEARNSKSGLVFTANMEKEQPDVWGRIHGLHQQTIQEGNIMLLDNAGNIAFQPVNPTENSNGGKQ